MDDALSKIIYWVATGTIGLVVSAGWFVVKKWLANHEDKEKELSKRIDDVDRNLQDYKLKVSQNYVSKDEFLRVTSRHDQKLDKILDKISELSERVSSK